MDIRRPPIQHITGNYSDTTHTTGTGNLKSASRVDSGILIPSLSVSLWVFSVFMFFVGFLLGILITKRYMNTRSSEKKQWVTAATQTTEPCPNYEEISPATNATQSAGDVDDIDIVDNQAYAPIKP